MEYRCLVYWKRVSCPRRHRNETHPLLFDFAMNPSGEPGNTRVPEDPITTTLELTYPGRSIGSDGTRVLKYVFRYELPGASVIAQNLP
eukprot:1623212-Rhodomonas_salina.1